MHSFNFRDETRSNRGRQHTKTHLDAMEKVQHRHHHRQARGPVLHSLAEEHLQRASADYASCYYSR